jgi:hypothetical protein
MAAARGGSRTKRVAAARASMSKGWWQQQGLAVAKVGPKGVAARGARGDSKGHMYAQGLVISVQGLVAAMGGTSCRIV